MSVEISGCNSTGYFRMSGIKSYRTCLVLISTSSSFSSTFKQDLMPLKTLSMNITFSSRQRKLLPLAALLCKADSRLYSPSILWSRDRSWLQMEETS